MSAFIVTVLKLLGSIVSGGLLFQAFVAHHHAKPITKIAGVIVSLMTLLMFIIDIKDVFPKDEADKTEQIYWESVEKHPSAASYRAYLNQYPDGQFVRLARTQIADYAQLMTTEQQVLLPVQPLPDLDHAINAEQNYWATIEKHPSAELYQDYLKRYPNGQFVETAHRQLTAYAIPLQQELPLNKHTKNIESTPDQRSTDNNWRKIAHYLVKDGLVKDMSTGLMWMRCSLGQNWQKESCQGKANSYSWGQAMNDFKNFNYAGYSDWRVPTRDELKTLVYCSGGKIQSANKSLSACNSHSASPTIVKAAFPETPAWFWSSSPYAKSSSFAWYVFFGYGYDDWSYKYSDYQLRLVRNTP